MTKGRAEYVIVGGGIYGVATAWHLARQGAQVLLLESRTVAAGASGGLGKRGVRANGRDIRELPLMKIAYEIWPSLASELGASTGWEQVGHLQLYEQHHHVGAALAREHVQSAAGIPTTHLTSDEVRGIEPGLSDVVLGALHCPRDAVAEHNATTAAYASRAREAGAEVREGATVTGLEVSRGRVSAVQLETGEQVGVGRDLLLLNNAGVPGMIERAFGRTLPVWSIFPQALRTSPAPSAPFRSLFGHAHRPLALKMLPNGSVMLSGGWRGRWNREAGVGEAIPEAVEGNWAEAVRAFPGLEGLHIEEVSADRAETSALDGIPIVDRLPEAPNVLFACGWSGHGWAIAPAVAPMLADWALTGDVPDLLRPFALGRFESGIRG